MAQNDSEIHSLPPRSFPPVLFGNYPMFLVCAICFQFTYADEVQMTFLRLLSTHVRQEITYHCKNSLAFDGKQKSINLRGENDIEINMKSPSKYRPKIIEDGCQVR